MYDDSIDFVYEPDGLSGNPFDQNLDGYEGLDGLFSKIKKGIRKLGRGIDKARRKVGRSIDKNVTQKVVKSKLGKIALGAAAIYFGGPIALKALKGTKLASAATKIGATVSKSSLVKKGVNFAVQQAVQKKLTPKIPAVAAGDLPPELANDVGFQYYLKTGKVPTAEQEWKLRNPSARTISSTDKIHSMTPEQIRRLPSHVRRQLQAENIRRYGSGGVIRRAVGSAVRNVRTTTGVKPSAPVVNALVKRVLPSYVKYGASLSSRTQDLNKAATEVAKISAVVENAPSEVKTALSSLRNNAVKVANDPKFDETVAQLKARGLSDADIQRIWGQSDAFKASAIPQVAKAVYPTAYRANRQQGFPPPVARERAKDEALVAADDAVKEVANDGGKNLLAFGLPLALLLLNS